MAKSKKSSKPKKNQSRKNNLMKRAGAKPSVKIQKKTVPRLRGSTSQLSAATTQHVSDVNGFDRGLTPSRIRGVVDFSGPLLFLVEWEGFDGMEFVPATIANSLCPQLIAEFYAERQGWEYATNNSNDDNSNLNAVRNNVNTMLRNINVDITASNMNLDDVIIDSNNSGEFVMDDENSSSDEDDDDQTIVGDDFVADFDDWPEPPPPPAGVV